MSKRFLLPIVMVAATLVFAHPMGNFSVSHYARFEPKAGSVDIVYVLDLAELPTFDLLRQWGLERSSPPAQLSGKVTQQAREWAKHLDIRADGKPVTPKFLSASYAIADGAGDLPIIRVTSRLRADATPGAFEYEDHNFPDRAGWKEIVIRPGGGGTIAKASQTSEERSKALTEYPQDPTLAPPQDVRASFEWTGKTPAVVAEKTQPTPPVIAAIPQPKAPLAVAPATMTPQAAPAGTVVKGDFLSRLLHQRELTLSMILIALLVAFGLGAAHALTPGHGKTIVAAYLVGSRGTLKHAAFLGAMVTFTHTVSVFLLGLATLFLFQYVMPEKITQALGVVSGLSIVAIGGWMLWKRLHSIGHGHSHGHGHHRHVHAVVAHDHAHFHDDANGHTHDHVLVAAQSHDDLHAHTHYHANTHDHLHAVSHRHSHEDEHAHTHDHLHAVADTHSHASFDQDQEHAHSHGGEQAHTHDHPHIHDHGKLMHSHGPGGQVHSHDVPDEITWGSLTALAVSGGLVPCESALVLLLSAIALGRIGLGLMLLVAFSIGLAAVLMVIGILVIYAKNLFPSSNKPHRHPAFQWIPVASAALVMCVGLIMTLVSMGWVEAKWMI